MSKEKCQKKVINSKAIAAITIALLICVVYIAISVVTIAKKTVYASAAEKQPEQADNLITEIDVMNILAENTKSAYREEFTSEQIDLEYLTTYEENSSLPKGMVQVLQEGRDGLQIVTTKKMYEGETLISEEEASRKIVKSSVNKIVQVGTGKYKSNYKMQVGDTLYVTPDTLGRN